MTEQTPLKPKSELSTLTISASLSKSSLCKCGIICGILFFGIIICLVYPKLLHLYYVRHTLPDYQRSLHLELNSKDQRPNYQPDRWHSIGDPDGKFLIYSAYFDDRLELVEDLPAPNGDLPFGSIRLITILPLSVQSDKLFCNFRYEGRADVQRARVDQIHAIRDHGNMTFATTLVTCVLSGNATHTDITLPNAIGLSYELEPSMINVTSFVRIHYNRWKFLLQSGPKKKLAVCVGPLPQNYSDADQIVGFIEYWQLLGADRFYFYNRSTSEDVNRVLYYYWDWSLAEMNDWNLEEDLAGEGASAAINDCIYRSTMLMEYAYTAVVDLAEFILPTADSDLNHLLVTLDQDDLHSFGFRALFPDEEEFFRRSGGISSDNLNAYVKNQKSKHPLENYLRSRYIAKGRDVHVAGNHFVWMALSGTKEHLISPETGLLFQTQQDTIRDGSECYVEDLIGRRYEKRVRRIGKTVCSKLFPDFNYGIGVCPTG
ncbi:uncharacterized protein LOC128736818 [Sabethes cyaneus]|uniref:uncharacterized protein LOC128736818 n=1 Tax=Sabethes cyaneus TaxID=53552 RepID=UPI00237E782C|nr:uncharacterized protein LOC128736818 [Sabethes cyaneus]